jgi:hypothetical protein
VSMSTVGVVLLAVLIAWWAFNVVAIGAAGRRRGSRRRPEWLVRRARARRRP